MKKINPIKIIGTPIKIENLEIAQYDFPDELEWEEATKACNLLGDGWRLPSKIELNTLYQNMDKIGGAYYLYWSSTEYKTAFAWTQIFNGGKQSAMGKCMELYVRAVRTI